MIVGLGIGVGRQRFAGSFADSYSSRVLADGGTIESLSCVSGASTLLQTASLLLIPSGYKAGVAYSALPNNGNGDLTWSRNSVANRTQSNGGIGSVAVNVPRLSYMYGSCPALLLEPQRTNLYLRSEDFAPATWSKSNVSTTANSTTSPDGTIDASLYIANGTTSVKSLTQSVSVTSGLVYTISVYAKKNTNDFIQITSTATFLGSTTFANFDLNNGVLGTVGAGGTATISNVGNGWYRCTLSGTATTTGSQVSGFYIVSSSTSIRGESNSLSTSVYLWGAQLEVGAYATTYILTTTATATRLADSFTRNNIRTNALISANGGTWFIELKNNAEYVKDSGDRGLFLDTSNTGNTNGFQLVHRTTVGITQRVLINKRISGADTIIYQSSVSNIKIAIKWNGTSADIFANGTKVVSATAFTPTSMEFLNFTTDGVPFFIQSMALFNTPLSDSNCQLLTT